MKRLSFPSTTAGRMAKRRGGIVDLATPGVMSDFPDRRACDTPSKIWSVSGGGDSGRMSRMTNAVEKKGTYDGYLRKDGRVRSRHPRSREAQLSQAATLWLRANLTGIHPSPVRALGWSRAG